ncbi:MAG: hypothetical protein M3494_01695 [Actinomycetota bacterium]|nr:hypothetical protein [Actinomycetota bacterium]
MFVGMTCCFGFPTRRKHAVGMSLAGRADIVMRRAKENGKNRTGAAG